MKKLLISVLLLILFIPFAVGAYFYNNYQTGIKTPASSDTSSVQVIIETGSGIRDIAKILKENGIIQDENYFYLYGRLNGKGSDILAGKFSIPRNKTVPEVYELLTDPVINEIIVTIPEGLRGDEIATTLEKGFAGAPAEDRKFSKTEFEKLIYTKPTKYISQFPFLQNANNLEGFLFPDTYAFFTDITTDELIIKLLQNFNTKTYSVSAGKINSNFPKGFTYYDVINLASIVEREGLTKEEKNEIASILMSRLNGNLPEGRLLQADATILYAKKTWVLEGELDTASNSPYNSYKFEGLPPTPICNPGVDSVLAVVNSKPTEYLYYLHKNGKFLRARTFQEHLNNLYN